MADIRPTPVSNYPAYYGAGLLSGLNEAVSKPFGYENDPVRNITNLMWIPGTVKTLENIAYGLPNVSGSGFATQLRPEAKDLAGNLMPLASGGAARAVRMAQSSAPKAAVSAAKENPNLLNWLGNGAINQPMYHGTWAENIEAFRPGRANAIFLSPDPKFASGFSVKAPSGSPNVLPVYTNVKQPFDYESAAHVKKLVESYNQLHGEPIISAKKSLKGSSGLPVLEQIKTGNWSIIENNKIQEAIKNAGFDAFYVKENGVKNLGVYDPASIKSVFNRGTFDPKDQRILYGGGATGLLSSQQERK
jgi:hypothetical protein